MSPASCSFFTVFIWFLLLSLMLLTYRCTRTPLGWVLLHCVQQYIKLAYHSIDSLSFLSSCLIVCLPALNQRPRRTDTILPCVDHYILFCLACSGAWCRVMPHIFVEWLKSCRALPLASHVVLGKSLASLGLCPSICKMM